MSGYPGYNQPFIDPAAVPQPPFYPNGADQSMQLDPDRRMSVAPSLAGSDPRMSIASYSQYPANVGSAADAYRSTTPTITPASAYASYYMNDRGSTPHPPGSVPVPHDPSSSLAGGAMGYSNPNAHSPRSSLSSFGPSATSVAASSAMADQISTRVFPSSGMESVDQAVLGVSGLDISPKQEAKAAPRLPSIEFGRSDANGGDKSEFWFEPGDGGKTPTSPPVGAHRLSGQSTASTSAAAQAALLRSTSPPAGGEEQYANYVPDSEGYSAGKPYFTPCLEAH